MFNFCKQIILFIKNIAYSGQEQVTDAYKGCNKPPEVTEGRKNVDWLSARHGILLLCGIDSTYLKIYSQSY
jgi:hypothetical protein